MLANPSILSVMLPAEQAGMFTGQDSQGEPVAESAPISVQAPQEVDHSTAAPAQIHLSDNESDSDVAVAVTGSVPPIAPQDLPAPLSPSSRLPADGTQQRELDSDWSRAEIQMNVCTLPP